VRPNGALRRRTYGLVEVDHPTDRLLPELHLRKSINAVTTHPMNTSDENFSDDDIATVARQIWEDEGRPEGKAEEHWERAIQHLRQSRTGGDAAEAPGT